VATEPDLLPMKAVSGPLPPDDDQWAYEIKWDGMRILSFVDDEGGVRLRSSNAIDSTARYPELADLATPLAGHSAVLDGEVVAFDDTGRPSFGLLQQRMHLTSPAEVARRAADVPIAYIIFDLLRLDGHDVCPLPYLERRRLLMDLVPEEGCWQVPGHRIGEGAALLEATKQRGLEGVMAKRIDSPYLPGKRSPAWRKVKARRRQEFVIGGWQPGEGGRAGRMGSLLVGYYEDGHLRFAGKVGTGFTMHELDRLGRLLDERAIDDCPFEPLPPRPVARIARWVRPELVAEIEFGEWTSDGILRHPAYLGLRDDKAPTDVVREG
jgi:bifunctional non-homologous end joining protein LigD